jgi:hypothetical protein
MWCPKDYHSWNAVLNSLFEATEEVLSRVALGGEPRTLVNGKPRLIHSVEFYLRSRGFASSEEEAELNTAITTCFLLSNFLQDYPPTLASLVGQFITVDSIFFEHKDQLHLCSYGWPLKSQTEYASFFEFAENGTFEPPMIFDRFAFIDTTTGEICVKNGSQRFLTNFTHHSEESAAKLIDLATQLAGFVVCWEDVPNEAEFRNFLSYLEVNDTFIRALDDAFGPATEAEKPMINESKRPIGRPSKKGSARRAYWSLFPDGHEKAGKVWKEVHQAVDDALGYTVDITTLKRAVREGRQKGQ